MVSGEGRRPPEEVDAIAVAWDTDAFDSGLIAEHYARMRQDWDVDAATRSWQDAKLRTFSGEGQRARHARAWRRMFGALAVPPVRGVHHHRAHALQAALQSPYDSCVVLTLDGSGDCECSMVWEHRDGALRPLRELRMPHSLGWFYAAFTEYLGFDAYDEEYKVMGLAAYGSRDETLERAVGQVLTASGDGVGHQVDASYLHYGTHTWSDRFTDRLPDLLGRPPRTRGGPLEAWHRDLAHAVQTALEEAVLRLVRWAVRESGLHHVAVGGGIANNVKLNGAINQLPEVRSVFAHPLCGDAGAAAGAALSLSAREGHAPERLRHVALGPSFTQDEVEQELRRARCAYRRSEKTCEEVADALADGLVVAWMDGNVEGGARALGQRSILADPREPSARDRVNEAVKLREAWRPFCPSLPQEFAGRYLEQPGDSRFMTVSCRATDRLREDAPAVVHVDGTVRPQVVEQDVLPRYHRLLTEFGLRTGVPVLLNTSFNVRGEPIVCSPADALRTFWASGLDMMAIGDLIVTKNG
uniref:Putative carbamoyl transferase n=1 Tax=Streptomyces sp. MMG1612 TaxID=1415547 RepID=U5YMY5_9ACTN|nr:putative carbamoyl transferase [Streptomyces sp. MMG1612]